MQGGSGIVSGERPAAGKGMAATRRARVITVGNEKGGSGKSTTAMHLVVGLMRSGRRVASIDLDARQKSLTRYLDNRRAHAVARGLDLPMPAHETLPAGAVSAAEIEGGLGEMLERLAADSEIVVVDTPGADSPVNRVAHSFADLLITPLNDSLLDLDVLARVDAGHVRILGPSHYAEMVWEQKMRRAKRDGGSIDWIVMRNRLSSLDARNKRQMAELLEELSRRIGFRTLPGLGERVVYRELFLSGLTMMDLREADGGAGLSLSHLAARQEVRSLIEALRLP